LTLSTIPLISTTYIQECVIQQKLLDTDGFKIGIKLFDTDGFKIDMKLFDTDSIKIDIKKPKRKNYTSQENDMFSQMYRDRPEGISSNDFFQSLITATPSRLPRRSISSWKKHTRKTLKLKLFDTKPTRSYSNSNEVIDIDTDSGNDAEEFIPTIIAVDATEPIEVVNGGKRKRTPFLPAEIAYLNNLMINSNLNVKEIISNVSAAIDTHSYVSWLGYLKRLGYNDRYLQSIRGSNVTHSSSQASESSVVENAIEESPLVQDNVFTTSNVITITQNQTLTVEHPNIHQTQSVPKKEPRSRPNYSFSQEEDTYFRENFVNHVGTLRSYYENLSIKFPNHSASSWSSYSHRFGYNKMSNDRVIPSKRDFSEEDNQAMRYKRMRTIAVIHSDSFSESEEEEDDDDYPEYSMSSDVVETKEPLKTKRSCI